MPTTGVDIVRCLVAALFVALLLPVAARAQDPGVRPAAAPGCDKGRIRIGENAGQVEICSALAAQVPGIQRQLDDVLKLLRERGPSGPGDADLRRLVANVDGVSANIGTARQAEMLKNLVAELQRGQRENAAASRAAVDAMNAQFETLGRELLAKLGNRQTSERAASALDGDVGDAIARLEPASASRLLDRLTSIDTRLGDVQNTVTAMRTEAYPARLAEFGASKPRGDLGQNAIAAALVADHKAFDGLDLSGVAFIEARLGGLRGARLNLTLSDLSRSDLSEATLEGSDLTAVRIDGTSFDRARMSGAALPFSAGKAAHFRGASLVRTAWFAVDLEAADFSGADLRGATFEDAALRGADFRGANLAGAFFGNADLRDARFEGAVFDNTDVVSALISTAALTAAQVRGLCATPGYGDAHSFPQLGHVTVIEPIPSSRYDGGYEHRRIVDYSRPIRLGGERPYAACRVRAKDAFLDGFDPVSHDPERWPRWRGFDINYLLLESGGRRKEFLDRVKTALGAAEQRWTALWQMPQFAALRQVLDGKIRARLDLLSRSARPATAPRFDQDVAMLMAARLMPDAFDRAPWRWESLGFWQTVGTVDQTRASPWPKLYPDEILEGDVSPYALDALKTWTRVRAAALSPPVVGIEVPAGIVNETYGWDQVMVYGMSRGQPMPSVAKELEVEPGKLAFFHHGFDDNYGFDIPFAVVLDGERPPAPPAGLLPVVVKSLRQATVSLNGKPTPIWVWRVAAR